ncbi:MAG: sugar phosphate isomerase/epimerase family protein [Armatimonadota bacterium]
MNSTPEISRLSLNQITTNNWSLKEAVEGCVRAGLEWIGIWRHKIEPLEESVRIVKDSGLGVSGLCRGGMFPAATAEERRRRIEDNLRAIDEAAALGTDVLVLVNGPAPDRDIAGARSMVADGIASIIPHARERGVKLAIEPLHPMFAAERSVICTLREANRLAERLGSPDVGIIVDVYHVWWDPDLYEEIEKASGRILGFHVSDWIVPTPDMLMGRGMMGDGVIEIRKIRQAVERAGYAGPIEVEIFNQEIWDAPGDEVLARMKDAYLAHV